MLSPLRNRFGIPGVISVIALVFAMFGGAYAATNSSDGDKATSSAKAKKGPRGPRGKTGKTGPAGPAGPQGPAGAKGDTGAAGSKGDAGAAGAPGAPGTSPAGTSFAGSKTVGSVTCEEGGIEYKGATTNLVCNGAEGEEGEAGILHPGETLPTEATETGTWLFRGTGDEVSYAPISFPIPLSAADAALIVRHVWVEGDPTKQDSQCKGTVNAPAAEPGSLCFYLATDLNGEAEPHEVPDVFTPNAKAPGVGTAGAMLRLEFAATNFRAGGSFAVTAP